MTIASEEAKKLAKLVRLDLKKKVKQNILPDIKYQVKVIVKTNHTKVRIFYSLKQIDYLDRANFYNKMESLYEKKYNNYLIVDVRWNYN